MALSASIGETHPLMNQGIFVEEGFDLFGAGRIVPRIGRHYFRQQRSSFRSPGTDDGPSAERAAGRCGLSSRVRELAWSNDESVAGRWTMAIELLDELKTLSAGEDFAPWQLDLPGAGTTAVMYDEDDDDMDDDDDVFSDDDEFEDDESFEEDDDGFLEDDEDSGFEEDEEGADDDDDDDDY
ncbi:MAG: hypothetical protein ACK54H_01310 [Phycisphaerales bacterium]